MLWQRSMLRAKPIRTVAKQPQTTGAPTPNKTSIVHAHMCTPLLSYIKLKTFREKENNTAIMTTTLTPHTVITAVRYIFSWFLNSLYYAVNFFFSPCSVFYSPKHGGWDRLCVHRVWIDFCLAHFSWFWLCHFQGAPDEGPLRHRCGRFGC